MRFALFAAYLVGCSVALAEPHEFRVRTSGELIDALEQAEPGATILLAAGHYAGPFRLAKDVELRELANPDPNPTHHHPVVLDSAHHGPVVTVLARVHVKLAWLNLVGGSGCGAAIVTAAGSTLEMHEVYRLHNDAGPCALMEIEGAVTDDASTIRENVAASLLSLGEDAHVRFIGTSASDNGAAVFATLCSSSHLSIEGGNIDTAQHRPFAYVLNDCPTMRTRIVDTEAKLLRRASARPLMSALPGVIDVDGAWVNGTRFPPLH